MEGKNEPPVSEFILKARKAQKAREDRAAAAAPKKEPPLIRRESDEEKGVPPSGTPITPPAPKIAPPLIRGASEEEKESDRPQTPEVFPLRKPMASKQMKEIPTTVPRRIPGMSVGNYGFGLGTSHNGTDYDSRRGRTNSFGGRRTKRRGSKTGKKTRRGKRGRKSKKARRKPKRKTRRK